MFILYNEMKIVQLGKHARMTTLGCTEQLHCQLSCNKKYNISCIKCSFSSFRILMQFPPFSCWQTPWGEGAAAGWNASQSASLAEKSGYPQNHWIVRQTEVGETFSWHTSPQNRKQVSRDEKSKKFPILFIEDVEQQEEKVVIFLYRPSSVAGRRRRRMEERAQNLKGIRQTAA